MLKESMSKNGLCEADLLVFVQSVTMISNLSVQIWNFATAEWNFDTAFCSTPCLSNVESLDSGATCKCLKLNETLILYYLGVTVVYTLPVT